MFSLSSTSRTCLRCPTGLAVVLATGVLLPPALGQFEVESADVTLPTTAFFGFTCPPDTDVCGPIFAEGLEFPGYMGYPLAWRSLASCENAGGGCGTASAYGEAQLLVAGMGTSTLRIRWDALARTDFDCCHAWHYCNQGPGSCSASASADITATLMILVPGPGDTRTVRFRWQQFSANFYDPEIYGVDDSGTASGSLGAAGSPLYGTQFNLFNSRGWWFGTGRGQFTITTGVPFPIDITAITSATINPPHASTNICEYDSESDAWGGQLILVVDGGLPPDECDFSDATEELEFSLDIGSDAELSDPITVFNGAFDPGDMYLWQGPPLPPGGLDGSRDDLLLFGVDVLPDPPDGPPPATGAPTCSGLPPGEVAAGWFDLDGSDSTDFSILGLVGFVPYAPLLSPVSRFPSSCVHPAQYLAISYEDDAVTHYVGCDVPTTATSPASATYGVAGSGNEVLGLLVTYGVPPVGGAMYPLADEVQLHASLGPPPPPPLQDQDDDVDALDCTPVLSGFSACTQWYYSADHEASGGRIPGAIYLGGLPVPVILPAVHLGLRPDVDLADFEFVWTPAADGSEYLTLLFAVHPDDPLTAADESGGLDPRMIYASYLTGSSLPFLAAPLADAVDGITACCAPIGERRVLIGDVNCDGAVNFGDINPFVLLLSNPAAWATAYPDCPMLNGDINGDGVVGFGDINPFVALLSGA